jgi:hypothetical protein
LEPVHESLKRYCPGIGLVKDNEAVLEDSTYTGTMITMTTRRTKAPGTGPTERQGRSDPV